MNLSNNSWGLIILAVISFGFFILEAKMWSGHSAGAWLGISAVAGAANSYIVILNRRIKQLEDRLAIAPSTQS